MVNESGHSQGFRRQAHTEILNKNMQGSAYDSGSRGDNQNHEGFRDLPPTPKKIRVLGPEKPVISSLDSPPDQTNILPITGVERWCDGWVVFFAVANRRDSLSRRATGPLLLKSHTIQSTHVPKKAHVSPALSNS